MSSEQHEPSEGDSTQRKPTSELWGPWVLPDEDSTNKRAASGTQFKKPFEPPAPPPGKNEVSSDIDPQATFREHVTATAPSLPVVPPAPGFTNSQQSQQPQQPPQIPAAQPLNPVSYSGYPPPVNGIPGNPGNPPAQAFPPPVISNAPPGTSYPNFAVPTPSYQGYTSGPPAYPPYGAYYNYAQPGAPYPYPYPYPFPYPPPQPKRDGYLLGVGIAAFAGSILVLLGGLASLFLLLFAQTVHSSNLTSAQSFSASVLFAAFSLVGIIGGGFGLYHSIRSVFLRLPSSGFAIPTFWLFVALYIAVIAGGFVLHSSGQDVANLTLLAVLILLAGFFPAMAVVALAERRLHYPKGAPWPTSWRRFVLAIVSGATMGILIAGALELALSAVLVQTQGINPLLCLNDPTASGCQSSNVYSLLFITVAIMAPIIEETVKPLGVIILIGRMRSAAETFVLGLACGVGFDLIETSGYISSSTGGWLNIALGRSGSGLLHGMGAAMVALGWYYLTHPGKNRVPKALGCWLYAVVQHALWNSTPFLTLLPGSGGQFFSNQLTIGSFALPYFEFVNIGEAIVILLFFLYITYRIRGTAAATVQAT